MAAKDRIQAIKQMVANDKKVTVSNLSSIFQVTEETIRRDLEKLEDEGFLTRTYGGAVLNSAVLADNIHFYKRAKSFYEEKQIIARNTLPFIKKQNNDGRRLQQYGNGIAKTPERPKRSYFVN